jgi:hypothetical protein
MRQVRFRGQMTSWVWVNLPTQYNDESEGDKAAMIASVAAHHVLAALYPKHAFEVDTLHEPDVPSVAVGHDETLPNDNVGWVSNNVTTAAPTTSVNWPPPSSSSYETTPGTPVRPMCSVCGKSSWGWTYQNGYMTWYCQEHTPRKEEW